MIARDHRDLNAGLQAFYATLQPQWLNRVMVLVISEFGRTPGSNSSGGTDHGAGGVMLVSGKNVRPGVLGSHGGWNLGAYNSDRWYGNVPVGIDYRDVYAGLLRDHLHVSPRSVLTSAYRGTPLQVMA